MNRLEEEILKEIPDFDSDPKIEAANYNEIVARAAACVALKFIEKAFKDSAVICLNEGENSAKRYGQWLRENSLLPEPEQREETKEGV